MPLTPTLRPRPKAFVFDAYGTLFDVHSAVMRHAARIGPDADAFSRLWRAKQLEYTWVLSLMGLFESFWTLTARALDHAFLSFPRVNPALRASLLDAYRVLDAYQEVPGALERLRGHGFKTAILSNGETGMLAEAVASAGLSPLLDAVLSVDAVGVYKTSPRAYGLVAGLGFAPSEIAFVSSNRWDVAGAAAYGFTPVWVNRSGAPDEYSGLDPVATPRDLDGIG